MTELIRLNRRLLLGSALAVPALVSRPARAAGEVIVRTPGGTYDDVMRRHVYEPFTKETGIVVRPVAATASKLIAMFRANNVELDLIDTGDGQLLTLERMGALAPIAYDKWKWSKPEDIVPQVRNERRVANFVYCTVLAYNKDHFAGGAPNSWADFWNAGKFPGPRMLADMASGSPNLEFALLADGVPKDQIYPIDVDRALKSMERIKPQIRRFWDTGALSAQMLSDKEVVAGSIWNGRLQVLIDRGAPLAYTWNEHMIQTQALGVFKDAQNVQGAQLLIDYMLQPEVQAKYSKDLIYGPTNNKAFPLLSEEERARAPGSPNSRQIGFFQNSVWWEDNRDRVNRLWSRWVQR
ncbi:ABC transporter substrate-binding protein [Roseomonas sp. SSH11]|uniref:ABC transporter substrate-binding protein n=1 Tax=Pararoseomonas baculiformis TaxID=2820812 RepID=A0ABS4AB08_9PROT|nr:ABC transporter substrate-binding protein [Pararoseomonas baculiformis]MBP0444194.1 ABC transporter substrate-binding protein [Pararoseomonas baculiformis]